MGAPRRANRRQRRGGRRGGPWGDFGGWDGPGRQGPPPWVAGLFGLGGTHEQRRGPRVRRGDVRSAILDVLRTAEADGEQVNGYQVIQQIAERSDGAWRPSPGSVYPTIQQLQDEGLVETDDERGRKTLALTEEGRQYVAEHADELAAGVAARSSRAATEDTVVLRPEAGDRPGHGRGVADRHDRVRVAAARRDRGPRRDPAQALRHPRRRRRATDDRRRGRRVDERPAIRISDAEREAAAADLGEHFAQGRLTADEHAERLEQVWAARTRGEVAPIFRDLPSPYAAVAPRRSAHQATTRYWNAGLRPFRRGVPAPLLVVLAVLIVFSAIAHFPVFLLGFAVLWFVVLRHRGPRSWAHARHDRSWR